VSRLVRPAAVALVGLTFKSEADAKDIIDGLELVYGETTVTYSPNVTKDASSASSCRRRTAHHVAQQVPRAPRQSWSSRTAW
jgi:hypothetical protein